MTYSARFPIFSVVPSNVVMQNDPKNATKKPSSRRRYPFEREQVPDGSKCKLEYCTGTMDAALIIVFVNYNKLPAPL